jgi:hypothetical protein
MLSHDLARILLEGPNLPIATHANNHTYSIGSSKLLPICKVGIYADSHGDHILIGNISKRNIYGVNGHIKSMIFGDVPEEWPVVI